MSQSILSRAINVLWFSVCMIGNVYQIVQVSNLYLLYHMSTAVTVDFPRLFSPPSVHVCFYTLELIKWEDIFDKNPFLRSVLNISQDESIEMIEEMVNNFTHSQKMDFESVALLNLTGKEMFDLTLDHNELFSLCGAVGHHDYRIEYNNCTAQFKISSNIRDMAKCFTFERIVQGGNERNQYDLQGLARVTSIPGMLMAVRLKNSVIHRLNEVAIMMSDPPEVPRVTHKNVFLTDLRQLFSLDYNEFENVLLPAPFETDCSNYPDFKSRDDCFDTCVMRTTIKKYGKIYVGPTFSADLKQEVLPAKYLVEDQEFISFKMNTSHVCNHQCRSRECHKTFYVPLMKGSTEYLFSSFLIHTMSSPKITTVNSQKLDFLEYLTDVASTFGFWIGLSVFSLIDVTFARFKSCCKKDQLEESAACVKNGWNQRLRGEIIEMIQEELRNTGISHSCGGVRLRRRKGHHPRIQVLTQDQVAQMVWTDFVRRKTLGSL